MYVSYELVYDLTFKLNYILFIYFVHVCWCVCVSLCEWWSVAGGSSLLPPRYQTQARQQTLSGLLIPSC